MKKLIIVGILIICCLLPLAAQTAEQTAETNAGTTEKELYDIALTKLKNKEHIHAKEDLDKLIELNPKNPDYYFSMGYLYIDLNNFPSAIKYLDKTIELDPKYFPAYLNRSHIKYKQKKYQECIQDANKVLEISPYQLDALYIRGKANKELGNLQDALADYNIYLTIENNYPQTFLEHGDINYQLEHYEDAIKSYKRAILLYELIKTENPDFDSRELMAVAYNQMAISKKELGRYKDAIIDLNIALNIDKRHANALYCNRGEMNYFLKNYKDALYDLNKSIETDPTLAEAYYYRSLVQNELGAKKEAKADFKKAKELGFTKEDIAKNLPPKNPLDNFIKVIIGGIGFIIALALFIKFLGK